LCQRRRWRRTPETFRPDRTAYHVAPSTLSAGIAELGALLQAPLADRATRRIIMTPLGATVVAQRK